MTQNLLISLSELLSRYQAGERNFAGYVPPRSLCNLDLSNIIFSGANLAEASLIDSKLCGAQLVGTDFVGAFLIQTDLSGADLTGANLDHAHLWGVNLRGAKLVDANLTRAQFGLSSVESYSNLTSADLRGSILADVRLGWVQIDPGYPRQLDCTGALLWNTTLPDGTFVAGPTYYQPSTHSGC